LRRKRAARSAEQARLGRGRTVPRTVRAQPDGSRSHHRRGGIASIALTEVTMSGAQLSPVEEMGPRQSRQAARQRAITEAVMAAGSIRIDELAERFEISTMTVHRDLDELEARGLLRKTRGVATALSTALVESSDVYRASRQL